MRAPKARRGRSAAGNTQRIASQRRSLVKAPDWLPGPKVSLNIDAAEAQRFQDLKIGSPFRLVKPRQTLRLYGISQRLSATILRNEISEGKRPAPKAGTPDHRFITEIGDISTDDARLLKGAIRAALDGQRDAYKIFDLDLPKVRRGGIEPPLICACYVLALHVWPERKYSKAARQWVTEMWCVTPPRVSQCKRAHGQTVSDWIHQAIEVAKAARVSRRLMLVRLFDLVIQELTTEVSLYLPRRGTQKGLKNWPPEHRFHVEFPAPLPSLELATQIGNR